MDMRKTAAQVGKALKEFVPSPPKYKGDGVAIWTAQDKNGNTYLRVSVLGGKAINCFKNEPKPKPVEEI